MSNYPKAKGTKAEGQAVLFLRRWWPKAERRALSGNQDKGDVSGAPFVVEVKHHKSWRPGEWLDELRIEQKNAGENHGFILARRPNHTGFVGIVPEETLAHLLDCHFIVYGPPTDRRE